MAQSPRQSGSASPDRSITIAPQRQALLLASLAIGFAALLCIHPVQAASLQVSPVTLLFQPGQPALGVTLRNTGDAPLTGQVRVFAWGQNGKEDTLDPVQALVASPPIMS